MSPAPSLLPSPPHFTFAAATAAAAVSFAPSHASLQAPPPQPPIGAAATHITQSPIVPSPIAPSRIASASISPSVPIALTAIPPAPALVPPTRPAHAHAVATPALSITASPISAPPLPLLISAPRVPPAVPVIPAAKRTIQDADTDQDDELVEYDEPFKWNCNQVRTRIRSWIDNGGMKVTEFQKTINVNANAYRNFMTQNGPYKGVNSTVYEAAYFFFREMEERGEKIPRKKAKVDAPAAGSAGATTTTLTKRGKSALTDFGDLRLDGEDKGKVKIFDTCDEVRKKINAYLQTPGITQASFLKDIAAQVGEGVNIQGKQLTDFRTKRGPDSGNTSRVYYGSYVFFEKIRVRDGKPKSKHRLEMEKIWKNGMDTTVAAHNQRITMFSTEYATQDKYGQIHIHRR